MAKNMTYPRDFQPRAPMPPANSPQLFFPDSIYTVRCRHDMLAIDQGRPADVLPVLPGVPANADHPGPVDVVAGAGHDAFEPGGLFAAFLVC
jgi:hypothetical protein